VRQGVATGEQYPGVESRACVQRPSSRSVGANNPLILPMRRCSAWLWPTNPGGVRLAKRTEGVKSAFVCDSNRLWLHAIDITGYIYTMQALTEKQRRVFEFIRDTIAERHTPPTRAEIADALGFASANAAQAHLRTLASKGVIALDARRSRSIRILSEDNDTVAHEALTLAVIGRVAAGAPILAVEHVERHCRVDPALFSSRPDYMLRVSGDSMIDAGIHDGDLLAVKNAHEVRPGAIGVFRWDDEVTVKRFAREGHIARLQAANVEYADIVVDTRREALSLEGLAVGVIRRL